MRLFDYMYLFETKCLAICDFVLYHGSNTK